MRRTIESLQAEHSQCCHFNCPQITLPDFHVTSRLGNLQHHYLDKMWRYPWAFVLFYVVLIIIGIAAPWRPVTVDTDLGAYGRVAGPLASQIEAYKNALYFRRAVRNATDLQDRLVFKLQIVYQAKDGSVLSEAALNDIRSFELSLRSLPGWISLCGSSDPQAQFRCNPGESLGNYLWPRRDDLYLQPQGYERLGFDGTGQEMLSVPVTLSFLGAGSAIRAFQFLPLSSSGPSPTSNLMRSTFTFTAPNLDDGSFRQQYQKFATNELYPQLLQAVQSTRAQVDPKSWDLPLNVLIYFSGDVVDDLEVTDALASDMKRGIGALVFLTLICWAQMRSFLLAFAGTLLMSFAVLLTYVIVVVPKVSITSFLAVFFVYALGTNVLFRMHDAFKRTEPQQEDPGADPANGENQPQLLMDGETRLRLLYKEIFFELAPVCATALCYLVYLANLIRPLREFGVFICIVILWACLLSSLVFVPVMILHDVWILPFFEKKLNKWVLMLIEPAKVKVPFWEKAAEVCVQLAKKGKWILIGTAVATIIALIPFLVVAATRPDDGVPDTLPPSDQKIAMQPLAQAFSTTSASVTPYSLNGTVCQPGTANWQPRCLLNWCNTDLPPTGAGSAATSCACHRSSTPNVAQCKNLTISPFVSGQRFTAMSAADQNSVLSSFVASEWQTLTRANSAGASSTALAALVLEHWASGATAIDTMIQMPNVTMNPTQPSNASSQCSVQVICYCGQGMCSAPNGFVSTTSSMVLPASSPVTTPAPAPSAAGQPGTEVVIVWGLTATIGTALDPIGLWGFDSGFDPVSPWAQRAMLAMCTDLPQSLRVIQSTCWISDFRAWLLSQGTIFPVERFSNFNMMLQQYLAVNPTIGSDLWLDANGKLRATVFHFKVSTASSPSQQLADAQQWQSYVSGRNAKAESTAANAWVASQAWESAEAYSMALQSSWAACLLAFLGMALTGLLLTADVELMSAIVLLSIIACIFLGFFMICIFQWSFGPWELMILTVFLSYSLEPAFHMCRDVVFPAEGVFQGDEGEAALPPHGSISEALPPVREDEESGGVVQPQQPGLSSHKSPGMESPVRRGLSSPMRGRRDQVPTPMRGMNLKSGHSMFQQANPGSEFQNPDDIPDGDVQDWDSQDEGAFMRYLEMDLVRSITNTFNTVATSSIKLILCGLLLIPCRFRLFSRLGAVAVMVPLIWLPSVLILLPAVILFFGRRHREPDLFRLARVVREKTAWIVQ